MTCLPDRLEDDLTLAVLRGPEQGPGYPALAGTGCSASTSGPLPDGSSTPSSSHVCLPSRISSASAWLSSSSLDHSWVNSVSTRRRACLEKTSASVRASAVSSVCAYVQAAAI